MFLKKTYSAMINIFLTQFVDVQTMLTFVFVTYQIYFSWGMFEFHILGKCTEISPFIKQILLHHNFPVYLPEKKVPKILQTITVNGFITDLMLM